MSELDDLVTFAVSVGRDVFDGNERIPPEVDRARATCEQLLAKPLGLADTVVWDLLLASAALIGEDDVAILVHELAGGSASAECPQCNRSWKLELESVREPSSTALPAELVRLAARASTAGHPAIAATLERLTWRAQCPSCNEWSPVLATVDALRA